MPHWGRPPGARLGKNKDRGWGRRPSWDDEIRFEEIEDSDDDSMHGVELDTSGFSQKRYASDELRFTGIDLAPANARRRKRQSDGDDSYSNGSEDSSSEGRSGNGQHMQLMLREKEDYLVERALERIRRAEMLGKTNVQLSRQELDALERQRKLTEVPKNPRGKKATASTSKTTATRPTKGGKSAGNAPAPKAIETRRRSKSSSRVGSAHQQPSPPYPLLPADSQTGPPVPVPYGGPGYYESTGRPSSSSSRKSSRKSSSQSLQQQQIYSPSYPPYAQPYPPGRYHAIPESSSRPPSGSAPPLPRPDPADPNWAPRTRSSSSLVPYPIDPAQYGYSGYIGSSTPDFDPRMPPPGRRIASGPPDVYPSQAPPPLRAGYYHRPPNESLADNHGTPSTDTSGDASISSDDDDNDDDGDDQGVQVDVVERSTGYDVRTRDSGSGRRTRGNGKTGAKGKK